MVKRLLFNEVSELVHTMTITAVEKLGKEKLGAAKELGVRASVQVQLCLQV